MHKFSTLGWRTDVFVLTAYVLVTLMKNSYVYVMSEYTIVNVVSIWL
jgi:hypothetical protein